MHHLNADELVDVVESRATGRHLAHLDRCADCQARVDELASVLRDVSVVPVPEPSPLFWDHLSRRVSEAVAAEPARHDVWGPLSVRSAWPVLAMASVVIVLVTSLALLRAPRFSPVVDDQAAADLDTAVTAAHDSSGDDPAWDLVLAVADDARWDDLNAAGLVRPGAAEQAVLELSAEEQRELVRLLREALQRTDAS